MRPAIAILEEVAARTGWDLDSQVCVLLRYIENQQSNAAFKDFLLEQEEEES